MDRVSCKGWECLYQQQQRVLLSYSTQAGILPQGNTLFYVVKDSKISLKRFKGILKELQLTASPGVLKMQMTWRKVSLVMFWGGLGCFLLFGLGFFVKKLLFMHLPEESREGKNQRTVGIHIQRKDRENRHLRSAPFPAVFHACPAQSPN